MNLYLFVETIEVGVELLYILDHLYSTNSYHSCQNALIFARLY